jgi:LacI family gluconate utilization system Gnt-I transcriptional repressor
MTDPSDQKKRGSVTMAEIGRLAGVSQVTVSRALSSPAKVSAATLDRIRDAIARTGFVPNAVAGALASNRSMLIAALVPSLTNIVYSGMLHTFTEIMWRHGYQIMLSETGTDLDREESAIAAHLSRRPDAILLTGIRHSPGSRRLLLNAGIPVVEVWDISDTPIDCCVGFSHATAGQAAADFAREAGYGFAATITASNERAIKRRDAFRERFTARGGSLAGAIDYSGSATLASGRQALASLLEQGLAPGAVIFCSSDQFAHGVLIEANARGLKVPRDLAVIGFGDEDFASATDPALTTIRVDRNLLGDRAAEALLTRFAATADQAPIHDIGFNLIRRASA